MVLLRAWLSDAPQKDIDKLAASITNQMMPFRDGEPIYFTSEIVAIAGGKDDALRLLGRAIDLSYCSYTAMDLDPAFDSIRATPEFRQIRQRAIDCQQRFVQFRAQNAP